MAGFGPSTSSGQTDVAQATSSTEIDDHAACVIVPGMQGMRDYFPSVPEPEAVAFRFELHGTGWATLESVLGNRTFAIPAFGHMTDGLGDLVRAALQIATGQSHIGVVFDEEPRRWGLAIEPAGLSSANQRIARLTIRDGGTALTADGWSTRPVWKWTAQPVLEGYVETDALPTP